MPLQEKLDQLRQDLEKMESEHLSMWKDYGSELSAGSMLAEEAALRRQIEQLEREIDA